MKRHTVNGWTIKGVTLAVVFGGTLLAGSRAMAALFSLGETVTATFNTLSPAGNSDTHVNLYHDGVAGSTAGSNLAEGAGLNQGGTFLWGSATAGFNSAGYGANPSTANFTTNCIEINQNIAFGGTYKYTVTDLTSAPVGTSFPSISGAAANLIEQLFLNNYNSLPAPNVPGASNLAGAFQLALWKLEYDGPGGLGGLGVTSGTVNQVFGTGHLIVDGGLGATLALSSVTVQDAYAFLHGLVAASSHPDVVALTNGTNQDQAVAFIATGQTQPHAPEPATLVIWGVLAALGLAYSRWRRLV